ncbi:MAG TPA: thiol:disulfide interchange protein DsbA/DsbL [Burkholderiales bacterium]|jgi:thiol:disulfide interchange protein DsbA|nr:thiol:disulfide interchange protein DsbA/DsbL [Burkholderiales bacterium]
MTFAAAAARWSTRILLLAAIAVSAPPVYGQIPPRARPDVDYRLIDPQPVATGERIEVIDFFWYGCPHCYSFQPALEGWAQHMPSDVVLRRIPAILKDTWAPHARIYYTLEALGEVGRLHQTVYHGYHVEELHMSRPDVMLQWAVRQGIDGKRWTEVYNSAAVTRKVIDAEAATRAYSVRGTPSLVIDGRYLTSPGMAGSSERMIGVLKELVELARRRRAGG